MTKITVLIAIYNAEKYLRTCLDSLRAQTLTEFQALCIDDCSTDASASIIDEYAAADPRFVHLTTKANGGAAAARNAGLPFAEGEYTTMLDSDDWFAPDTLQRAYDVLQSDDLLDAVLLRLVMHEEGTGEETAFENKTKAPVLTGAEAFRLSLDWSIHGLYVVRTTLQRDYPYDASLRLYSDDNTTRIHYLHARRVAFCAGTYFYRKHAQSHSNACSVRRFDFLPAQLGLKRLLEAEARNNNLPDPEQTLRTLEVNRWKILVGYYAFYLENKQAFSAEEQKAIVSTFSQTLKTIEPQRLPLSLKLRPGFFPFRNCRLFMWEERACLALRKVKRWLRRS